MTAASLGKNIQTQFAGNILFSLLMVAAAMLTARILGPADRGLLRLAQLLPLVLTKIFSFGLDVSSAAFPGLYPDRRRELFLLTVLLSLAGSLLAVLVEFLFFALPFPKGQFGQMTPMLIALSLVYIPFFMLAQNLMTFVRGCGQISRSVRVQLVQTATLLVLLLIWIFAGRLTVVWSMVLFILCTLPGIGLAAAYLRPYWNFRWLPQTGSLLKTSLRFGLQVSLSHIASFLVLYQDQIMLGFMVPLEQVGQYMISVSIAERMRLLPNAVSMAFLPHLSSDLQNRQAEVPRTFRLTLLFCLLSIVPYGLLGAAAIILLLGRPYAGSIAPFLVLIAGVAVVSAADILAGDLAARQKPKYAVINGYTTFLLNLVLNFLFIPSMSIIGAALASTLAYWLSAALWIFFYLRESKRSLRCLLFEPDDFRFLLRTAGDLLQRTIRRFGKSAEPA
ncbi:MAG: oligosaccharide flippase family protein [Anaerohalosphaeraceae bacterium]